MKQKEIFLASEGDAWFDRNHEVVTNRILDEGDPAGPAIDQLAQVISPSADKFNVLEVGCGEGTRLHWIRAKYGWRVCGIDPSIKAVEEANTRGVPAQVGSADSLPFEDGTIDLLIFGFCLYLCDPSDLFVIAMEADRVLKEKSWLIIHDFYSTHPVRSNYKHKNGILTTKMDFRNLFVWNPSYTCYEHYVRHIERSLEYVDDADEWIGVSTIRKISWDG